MASSTFSQIGHFLPGDILFFVVMFIICGVFAIYFGRGRMVSVILAFYLAGILYSSFPFMNKLLVLQGEKLLLFNKLGIFLLFLVPISLILYRYLFSESEYSGSSHLIRTAGLALIGVIIVVMTSYTVLSYDALHNFSPSIDALFMPTARIFYWNTGIIALLALL